MADPLSQRDLLHYRKTLPGTVTFLLLELRYIFHIPLDSRGCDTWSHLSFVFFSLSFFFFVIPPFLRGSPTCRCRMLFSGSGVGLQDHRLWTPQQKVEGSRARGRQAIRHWKPGLPPTLFVYAITEFFQREMHQQPCELRQEQALPSATKLCPGKSSHDLKAEFINSRFLQRSWHANNMVLTQRVTCRYKSGEGISEGSCQPESCTAAVPSASCWTAAGLQLGQRHQDQGALLIAQLAKSLRIATDLLTTEHRCLKQWACPLLKGKRRLGHWARQ